jgi:Heterokaryon incompatibility protein (HET)
MPPALRLRTQNIVNVPPHQLNGGTFDLNPHSKVNIFRFIDCAAFSNDGTLSISETSSLHGVSYAAISYVWRGLDRLSSQLAESFEVVGAEDGDRISLSVLRTACEATRQAKIDYLWLDRICILQSSKEDKRWQIRNMAQIYKNCRLCFVLPGGLGGLVELHEETSWIQRAWTLQEAMLPASTKCLFRWKQGNGGWSGLTTGNIEVVERGICAMASLHALLQASLVGSIYFDNKSYQVRILGHGTESVMALMGAMNLKEKDAIENSIWRSALMRTSGSDIDVVYSIMGLFNVTLDPSKYTSRLQATVALAQSIMRNGGKANWMAAALRLPVPPKFCTLPELPVANVEGSALFQISDELAEAESFMRGLDWYLKDAPTGVVDDNGTIEFTAPMSCIAVKPHPFQSKYDIDWGFDSLAVITVDGKEYQESEAFFAGEIGTHAIVVGRICQFMLPATSARADPRDVVLMLVKPSRDAWHKTGMAAVSTNLAKSWQPTSVRVGLDI